MVDFLQRALRWAHKSRFGKLDKPQLEIVRFSLACACIVLRSDHGCCSPCLQMSSEAVAVVVSPAGGAGAPQANGAGAGAVSLSPAELARLGELMKISIKSGIMLSGCVEGEEQATRNHFMAVHREVVVKAGRVTFSEGDAALLQPCLPYNIHEYERLFVHSAHERGVAVADQAAFVPRVWGVAKLTTASATLLRKRTSEAMDVLVRKHQNQGSELPSCQAKRFFMEFVRHEVPNFDHGGHVDKDNALPVFDGHEA